MKFKINVIAHFIIGSLALASTAHASQHAPYRHHHHHQFKHDYKHEGSFHDYKHEALAPMPAPIPVVVDNHNTFEIIGGLGIAKLKAGRTSLGVTGSETDRLVQTNSSKWNFFGGQLGLGYIYLLGNAQNYSDDTQWFPMFEPQLNVYHLSGNSLKGNVWRFGSADFNDLTYDIPIRSTRLMLDGALTIVSNQRLSLYALGGIGRAWNSAGYRDAESSDDTCNTQRISLRSARRSSFSWELGAGVLMALNPRMGLSLEYLYTNLGTVKTSANGDFGLITTPVAVPAKFNLRAQTVLLALHIAL